MVSRSDNEETVLAPHDVMHLQMAEAYPDMVDPVNRLEPSDAENGSAGITAVASQHTSKSSDAGSMEMNDSPDMSVGWYASPQND